MTTYVEPLDTYAEMSHLIPREAWPTGEERQEHRLLLRGARGPPAATPRRRPTRGPGRARWTTCAATPAASGRGASTATGSGFDWGLLVGRTAGGRRGSTRSTGSRTSSPPSATCSRPAGSVQYRLGADQSGYENLFLAGDWVKTGLDAGCVEAAVMSGMQASRAICGVPERDRRRGPDAGSRAAPGHGRRRRPPACPPYVDYGGLATCPSPVDCDDATLYSFFLEGDHDRLAALCDKVFAKPSDGRLDMRPLGPHVMLSFGTVEKIKPQLEPWCRMGFARELQVAFWVPVVAVRSDGILPVGGLAGLVRALHVRRQPAVARGRARDLRVQQEPGRIKLPVDGGPLTLKAYGGELRRRLAAPAGTR